MPPNPSGCVSPRATPQGSGPPASTLGVAVKSHVTTKGRTSCTFPNPRCDSVSPGETFPPSCHVTPTQVHVSEVARPPARVPSLGPQNPVHKHRLGRAQAPTRPSSRGGGATRAWPWMGVATEARAQGRSGRSRRGVATVGAGRGQGGARLRWGGAKAGRRCSAPPPRVRGPSSPPTQAEHPTWAGPHARLHFRLRC